MAMAMAMKEFQIRGIFEPGKMTNRRDWVRSHLFQCWWASASRIHGRQR
jgi:hypothetical protein